MGQIVLVPPKRAAPSSSGYDYAPVVFTPTPPVHEGSVIQAYASIPRVVEHTPDPMIAYSGLIGFGRFQVGSRDTAHPCGSYTPWPTTISLEDLRLRFWDFSDLQDFVRENLVGDLLAQYDQSIMQWEMVVCNSVDQLVWNSRISQHKAVEFAVDGRLKNKVEAWLKAECGIFDLVETRYGGEYPIRVFIKNEDEALYFKLRWSGVDVEKELAEST